MAFFCCEPRTGAIVVGVLNLTIGLAILIEFFLGHIDLMDSLSESWDKLNPLKDDDNSTTTTTTTTTLAPVTFPPNGDDEEECNFGCWFVEYIYVSTFYLGFVLLFVATCAEGLCAMLSGCLLKNSKKLIHAAMLLTALMVGFGIGFVVFQFVLGYHWIDLLSIFVWYCLVNIYFCTILAEYYKSSDFQRVPVSA